MPFLRGPIAKEARTALGDLSARFLRFRPGTLPLTLADGLPGVALAHAALDSLFPDAGHHERTLEAVSRMLERLNEEPLGPSLFLGIAGAGWVTSHMIDGAGDDDADPALAFDAALEQVLATSSWLGPFDLVAGLVGVGVYALERLPRATGKRMLARVVEHLEATARPQSPGLAWWSNPEWIPAEWRSGPNPDWSLGVAHGMPGVIAFLGHVAVAEVGPRTRKKARKLLDGAVAWVLAQELPADSPGCFASAVAPGLPREPARLAWCNGDLGVAAALLSASTNAKEPDWERAAIRVATRAANRPLETAGISDAGLCHGAAGAGHLFLRLYQATGEKRLAAASRFWFERALAMRAPGRGFAGYRALGPDPASGKVRWRTDPGLLTGAAGITLALTAAVTETSPAWDRVFLVS